LGKSRPAQVRALIFRAVIHFGEQSHRWRSASRRCNQAAMKLQQNQVWRVGDRCLRIVKLERMSVDYKLMADPSKKEGAHQHATKKEFCRLLKGAVLVDSPGITSAAPEAPHPGQ
jgi:hypothetical protein